MAEQGIAVDHSTVHRCVIKPVPLLGKAFRRHPILVPLHVDALANDWRSYLDLIFYYSRSLCYLT
jgi:transposase-like protein